MKKLVFLSLVINAFCAFGSVHMPRVNPSIFIHEPEVDFAKIEMVDETLKRSLVEQLFNADLLSHEETKAYDLDAKFNSYYEKQQRNYFLFDLNADKIPELIFCGKKSKDDEKEFVEIYFSIKGNLKEVYNEPGHILAYKINPNTKEVLLYHHEYPCCSNASHNLNRLRLINGKFQMLRSYFLGRDSDMKGMLFPETSEFQKKYKQLRKGFELRWSPEVMKEGAWQGRTNENLIAKYDSLAVYVELAKFKQWRFILVKTPPMDDKNNRVINTANFTSTAIYGWKHESD